MTRYGYQALLATAALSAGLLAYAQQRQCQC